MFDLQRRTYQRLAAIGDQPLLAPVGLAQGRGDALYVCDSEAGAVHCLHMGTLKPIRSIHAPDVLQRPTAAAWLEDPGELYVVDTAAHDIKVFSADGDLERVLGKRGSGPGELNFPVDIAWDGELLWVVDAGNGRVQGFTRDLEFVAQLGKLGDAAGDFALPKSVAVSSDGQLFVVDARFENVQVFSRAGQLLLSLGGEGQDAGEFSLPAGISIDPSDRVWICDTYNRRIQVFDYRKERPGHE